MKLSFSQPELTANVSGVGRAAHARSRSASSAAGTTRSASTRPRHRRCSARSTKCPSGRRPPFHPRSPYGTAKVFGYYTTLNYRESYGIHASNGILFNHTSPRRGLEFVERKITNAVARISLGLQGTVTLGNLDTSRDFGYAGDYVEAMWQMLQQDAPGDYVVATGCTWSIRQVLDIAFQAIGIDDWSPHVSTDDRFLRPAEVDQLVGDASKARDVLGWEPKVTSPRCSRRWSATTSNSKGQRLALPNDSSKRWAVQHRRAPTPHRARAAPQAAGGWPARRGPGGGPWSSGAQK